MRTMVHGCGHDPYRLRRSRSAVTQAPVAGSMPAWAPLSIPGTMWAPGTIVSSRIGSTWAPVRSPSVPSGDTAEPRLDAGAPLIRFR